MKEFLKQWLSRRPRMRGVLACGVRFPDKTALTQSWSPEFAEASLENAWRCASDAFQVLNINSFPDQRVRWVFENGLLHCARREDGICLGIFTAKGPGAVDAREVERLITEFRALRTEMATSQSKRPANNKQP